MPNGDSMKDIEEELHKIFQECSERGQLNEIWATRAIIKLFKEMKDES